MSDNLDPDSLTAILGMCLEDQSDWEEPLCQFQTLIKNIRSKNPIAFDDPFSYLTDNFIYISVPNIVRKCLSLTTCNIQNYVYVINFFHEVILLIKSLVELQGKSQLIPLLSEILDDAQGFHVSRVSQTQTYDLCLFIYNNRVPLTILNFFSNTEEFRIEDFVSSMSLFSRVGRSLGKDFIFGEKTEESIQIICDTLERFAIQTEDRKIPFKQILDIIGQLILISTGESVQTCLLNIMMHFVDNEIIDIKFSGVKICVTLFTHVIPTEMLSETQQELLMYVLCQTNSNLESLSLLKPVLIKFVEKNLLDSGLLDNLWESIMNVPPSVIQKGYDLFADVVLKTKAESKDVIDLILQKVVNPPNIDLLCRLIKGPQFSEAVVSELSKLAEKGEDFNAVEALVKVAPDADLSGLLPFILDHLSNPSFLKDHIILINSISSKKKTDLDTSLITRNLAKNINMFSVDELNEIMKALAEILTRTGTKIPKDDLAEIFKNCQNNDCLFKVIDFVFTEKDVLAAKDSFQVVFDLIDHAASSLELFPILRHFYLKVNDQELKEKAFQTLWKILLEPLNEEQRKSTSELLLTFSSNLTIPHSLTKYVKLCLDDLLTSENPNSATFINECLTLASKFVLLEHFGLEPHRFSIPEDLITVSVDYSGSSNHQEISINNQKDVSDLIVVLSSKLNRDVTSMILYSKGKSVPLSTRLIDTDLKFEIRFKTEYDRVPPFTLQNHPISLFNEDKYIKRMLQLLDSKIGEQVYNVLINIPTPKLFSESVLNLDLNPSKPYLFLYQLHYLAKHLNELPNKSDLQVKFENILCGSFESIIPEARYLLILLLNAETKNERLVTKVLYTLCIEKKMTFFVRIMRKLWSIVSNFEIDLDEKILSAIILKDNQKFYELAMKSHLIQTQKFEKIWRIFTNISNNEDKLKHVKIFTMISLPSDKYQEIFDELYPLFDSLDEFILSIFAQMSDNWSEFPADKIANTLITSYIKCTTKPQSISENPFKLILSIAEKNENMQNEIIDAFQQTIPDVIEWNYQPTDSFKCNDRCGLENLGATCYVNSGLQQIFNIEPLRNFIISTKDFLDPSMKALHKLFTQMEFSHRKFIDMHSFASQWTGWDGTEINPREQQDVNDFLMLIFTKLEIYPDIYSLFSGETEMQFVDVTTDKVVSAQKSTFSTFPLIVQGQKSIKDSMKIASIPEIIDNYKVDDKSTPIQVKSLNIINSLPPYLFIQLKRFDYSIETQTRIKIDQRYEFELEFDFKDYVNYSGETRFRLIGVILHQGDVDVGHYISYTRVEDDKWRCLNDTSVTIVSDTIMMNQTYGNPDGSTGYILVYERFDASKSADVPIEKDPELIDEIQTDNLRLIVDSVYFSPYFADFVEQLILKLDFNNEKISNAIFKYTFNSLVHSSLVDSFNKIIDTIIVKINESENILNLLLEFISSQINIIVDVMTKCTNKSIKFKFSDLIKEIYKCQIDEPIFFISIFDQMDEWYPKILDNWRNGFDFFKIFYDFISVKEENVELFTGLEIIPQVISMVVDSFPKYVANKDNKITQSRFVRLIDMTWIFNLLDITNYPVDEILKPSFMKWCVGSEKHSRSFINLIQSNIPNLGPLVSQCGTKLSENFVAELVLNSPVPFQVPQAWLHEYFLKAIDRKHLLQAITDGAGSSFALFRKFAAQKEVFQFLLFVNEENVSDELIIYLRTLEHKIAENANSTEEDNMTLDEFASILFRFVEVVPEASGSLYHSNKDYLRKTVAPPAYFLGTNLLNFLIELAPKIGNLRDQVKVVSDALNSIASYKPKHDEHIVLLSIIGCTMMRDEKINFVPSELVSAIEYTLSTMTNPEHQQLQSLLRALVIGLAIHYDKSKLSTNLIVPDEPIAKYLFTAALSKDPKPLKRPVIDLLKICGKRYAMASKSLKFFFHYLAEIRIIDMVAVYEILSEYGQQSFESNFKVLDDKKDAFDLLATQFYFIKDKKDAMINNAKFLNYMIEQQGQKVAQAIKDYKSQIQSLCRFAVDERNDENCRAASLLIISLWIKAAHFDIYEYASSEDPILSHFRNPIQDDTQECIDKFTETLIINSKSDEKIRNKLPTELLNSFSIAKSGDQRFYSINSIDKISLNDSLSSEIVKNKLLQKMWSLEYKKEGISLDGLYNLSVNTKPQWDESTAKEIQQAAEVNPSCQANQKIIEFTKL